MNHNEKGHIGEDAAFKQLSAGNANESDNTRYAKAFKPASLWVDSMAVGSRAYAWKNLFQIAWLTITMRGAGDE